MGKCKSERTVPSKTRHKSCPHCISGPETFLFLSETYKFDVDAARKIVADGREPIELEPEDVQFCVESSHIHRQHLPHVDIRYPGIIAHYWFQDSDGTLLQGNTLIDGHHRAARCLELNVPFFVHILSEEESRQITLKTPGEGEAFLTCLSAESTHGNDHA